MVPHIISMYLIHKHKLYRDSLYGTLALLSFYTEIYHLNGYVDQLILENCLNMRCYTYYVLPLGNP